MSERSKNLARSRRKTASIPTTVLSRIHARCQDGMHLWCPGTVGRKTPQACLCGCHKGVRVKHQAAAT